MNETMRVVYEPAGEQIRLRIVNSPGERDPTFECDEVCDSGYCVGPDELTQEREVSVRDIEVERRNMHVIINLIDVISEPNE